MTTSTLNQTQSNALLAVVPTGVIAGLVGGGLFGVQMLLAGMMPMIAGMTGSESVLLGFIIHMLISAFIGGTFAVITTFLPQNLITQTGLGAVYGIVWWVLGALIIMPLALGMGEMVLTVGEMQIGSLIGHIIFGLVMGVVFFVTSRLEAAS